MTQPRTFAEIVTYAERGKKHANFSALAGYCKNLFEAMDSTTREAMVVLSDVKSVPTTFTDSSILVDECFTRNPKFLGQIIRALKKYPDVKVIHLQHEFNLFGGAVTIPMVLLLLFYLKVVAKKQVVVTFHGVISQKIVDRNFVKLNNLPLSPWLSRVAFRIFFTTARPFIHRVILHSDKFKSILQEEYGYKQKISAIPIGIETVTPKMSHEEARKLLGIPAKKRVLLYFGFLAGYKGLDLLIDAVAKLDDQYLLLVAGGKPKRTENDPTYNAWYDAFVAKASLNSNVRLAGFLPNDQLETYFMAADLAVFPYIIPVSSGAALAAAISYSKPSIVSEAFDELVPDSMVFKNTPESLQGKIEGMFSSSTMQANHELILRMKEDFTQVKSSAKTAELLRSLL